ncbi:glycoside hydrolase family 76 protein [Trichoderma sp. SZMC 28014]
MSPLPIVYAVFALAFPSVVKGAPGLYEQAYCSVAATDTTNCRQVPDNFLPHAINNSASDHAGTDILEGAFSALAVLQNEYYQIGRNTWPSAIDWTAAVTETVVIGMLSTLTQSQDSLLLSSNPAIRGAHENLISSIYDQVIGYHFEQDVVAIRDQAFDDILWVVLGWIEATNFARLHNSLHFSGTQSSFNASLPTDVHEALASLPWRGQFWIPSFQSRAKSFWLLGAQGWDTALCHGGMVWNPRLEPYKNAITNELYVSASISMYQYLNNGTAVDKDPFHLQAAVEGYKWLKGSNMTNSQGLFVDGFHIDRKKPGNVECDVRDEMVYTYNQGVLLTGQRGLWDVTGSPSYLADGHDLIQAVIKATGWSLKTNQPIDLVGVSSKLPKWRGLGRGGILEEECDASGTCSQDGQTFKGIYFHHLNAFCRPLQWDDIKDGNAFNTDSFGHVKAAHRAACGAYLGWIKHNALAALRTRDSRGRFGMWWGSGIFGNIQVSPEADGINHKAVNSTDYRNHGTPQDEVWGRSARWRPGAGEEIQEKQAPLTSGLRLDLRGIDVAETAETVLQRRHDGDANDRGRGRTVETQAGGVALLRAYWDISQSQAS